MKAKIVFIFVVTLLLGTSIGLKFLSQRQNLKQIKINNRAIFVEIADTDQKRALGLSGRNSLNQGQGMLFIFKKEGHYTFWMNKMKFDLDFVFVQGEKVVDLVEDVPFPKQGEEPRIVVSKDIFDKVLEINSGVIQSLNIKIGDKVIFNP